MRVAATWLYLAVGLLTAVQLRDRVLDVAPFLHEGGGVYAVPSARWLPPLSLGYREAFADLLWMRALVYYGTELGAQGNAVHALDYLEGVVTLDPWFERAYIWAGTGGVYHQGATAADVERSVQLMERGRERFPEDGDLAWQIGATLAYELPGYLSSEEAKAAARRRAQPFLEAAAQLGGGPSWLVLTNVAADLRLGERERAIAHLESMYAVVTDPALRTQIFDDLANLRSAEEAATMEAARRDFVERKRADYPYVGDGLYLLLAPRVVPPSR